jgi:hypothetical protein
MHIHNHVTSLLMGAVLIFMQFSLFFTKLQNKGPKGPKQDTEQM